MYPRSTMLGCFVLIILLIILLFVISSWDLQNVFLTQDELYNDTNGKDHILIKYPRLEYMCLLVSLPFLLLTFLVYSILPDLQNMHGLLLRVHVASLFVTNLIKFCADEFLVVLTTTNYCFLIAYIYYFSTLSSLFWLNVICFNTWWTLRQQFRLYQINLKKQEKKMFIMYSIYAWGISLILNIAYAILDISGISKHFSTAPEIWYAWKIGFGSLISLRLLVYDAKNLVSVNGIVHFLVPVGVSSIVNICLFIAMVLRTWYHEQTINQLRNSRSSHNNKNKFIIYVKLSVVLGINWIMQIILWFNVDFLPYDENVATYLRLVLWHITQKRFGCPVHDPVNMLRNDDCSCTSPNPTTPLTAEIVYMQEISPSNQ